jgi:hypothetical protein
MPKNLYDSVMLRNDKLEPSPFFRSLGWALAGVMMGSVAVVICAWGFLHLTDRQHGVAPSITMTPEAQTSRAQ